MGIVDNALMGASGQSGYNLTRSLRFRSSASAYLSRTPAVAGNRTTWTLSAWVKRGALSTRMDLFGMDNSNCALQYYAGDSLATEFYNGAGADYYIASSAVYRDPASWYHLVSVWDTTNATAADRQKLYVNGTRITSFSATGNTVALNAQSLWNSAAVHNIGRNPQGGFYFDGEMTEINFVDGQALTPSSFGSTNTITGVWQPKKYAGTYGTNGFYLPFTDNSAATATTIGKDFSGNGNNWTPNNISVTAGATYDSMTDVPTLTSATVANYAVLNPLDTGNTPTNANLTFPAPASAWKLNRASMSIPLTAKAYWEITISGASSNNISCGVATEVPSLTAQLGSTSAGWAIIPPNSTGSTSANKYNGGTSTSVTLPSNSGTNDVYMFAVDRTSTSIWIGINGNWVGTVGTSGQIFSNLPSTGDLFPGICTYNTLINTNFGQQPWIYSPPTGFLPLNTYNI